MKSYHAGFTAVELLVALVVGVLLLGSGYQLYGAVMSDSNDSIRQSYASGVAYQLIRQHEKKVTTPCAPQTFTPAVPSSSGLSNATATVSLSCPYGTDSNLSLVTAKVVYFATAKEEVTRAIVVRP